MPQRCEKNLIMMMRGCWRVRTMPSWSSDVGSNIGQAAFIMLLSQKIKRLILVEANPRALVFAADNLITNHC
jgi:hypothetical protein